MNTKRNNGNEQQPYIPAGHGKESGQYTNKVYVDNNYDDFIIKEGCTQSELEALLTESEYNAIKEYTNPVIGCALNKANREDNLTIDQAIMTRLILNGISRHNLKDGVEVYRGITVTNEVFIKDFYNKYVNHETINGSRICSTSRKLQRAIESAKTNKENCIGIIFVGILPKGYNALPVEKIAYNPQEKEIIIAKPVYKIKSIETGYLNNKMVKIIRVELKGANQHEH